MLGKAGGPNICSRIHQVFRDPLTGQGAPYFDKFARRVRSSTYPCPSPYFVRWGITTAISKTIRCRLLKGSERPWALLSADKLRNELKIKRIRAIKSVERQSRTHATAPTSNP
jgi:hypothetical protein